MASKIIRAELGAFWRSHHGGVAAKLRRIRSRVTCSPFSGRCFSSERQIAKGWRRPACWPTYWSASTAIPAPSIGNPRCSLVRVWSSIARRWPTAWAVLPGGLSRWGRGWPSTCSALRNFSPPTRRSRCLTRTRPDQDRPAVGLCPGRFSVERAGSTRRRLLLKPPSAALKRPVAHLGRLKGTVQVDGYPGFEQLVPQGHRTGRLHGRHTRWKFYEVHQAALRAATINC
jgi:hypothetical protein